MRRWRQLSELLMFDKLQALIKFRFWRANTAKGLRSIAQGCRASRLPWEEKMKRDGNPNGVMSIFNRNGEQDCRNLVGVESVPSRGSRAAAKRGNSGLYGV